MTALASFALLAACGGVSDEAPPGEFERAVVEWQVVFEDEFDGGTLDASKWTIQTGDGTAEGIPGWGNNELQTYAADNISVSNGVLSIQAREDSPGVYSSGRLNSLGKFDFTYGRVEIRAKLPAGQGMWPAAWMLHSEGLYGPWPASGEIDIMEAFNPGNGNNDVAGSIHFGIDDPNRTILSSTYNLGVSPDLDFHIYEVEWEKGQIRFFVDGQHFQTIKSDEWYAYFKAGADGFFDPNGAYKLGLEAAPFDQQFHLLLNLAVGGDAVGAPDAGTVFPQTYEIDFVRVYQCANANPTTGRGCGRADPSIVPLVNGDPLKVAGFDIFKDGPEVVEISLGQETATNTLQVGEFNGNGTVNANDPMFTDPDDPTNTVWHVNIAGSGGVGNVFIGSEEFPEGALLETGFDLSSGDIAGQLVFDMMVNSISGTTILIKMDSGFPNAGEVALPSPVVGVWQTYAIDISELLANPAFVDCCGGQGLDLANVLNLFVFEVLDGDVDVYLDNISVNVGCKASSNCRAQPKGSPQDVIVFDDAVGTLWDRGIVGFDNGISADYTDPQSANKINWVVKPADDPARGNIIEVLFKDNADSGVWFIGVNQPGVDLSGYAEGALVFDIRVTDYDTATSMTMKVDCFFPCGSGDQLLGRIADGVWETITIPVSQLVQGGLDLTAVNTGITLFPGFAPVGVTFQVDNIRWTLRGFIPEPTLVRIDLPVTFAFPFTDYTLIDFGDPVSASTVLGTDPDDSANTVAITTKPSGAPVWAGTTIGNPTFANPIPFTMTETSMSVDVRVPLAGIPVRLKVETATCPSDGSDTTCFAELDAFPLMADQWETLTWDFSLVGIDTTQTFQKASIFFDFGTAGNDAVYYWDNVRFGAPAPPPSPVIALTNGGFETGDFSGWTGSGDNMVGAPGVGARSGTSAASLNSMSADGVAEISQIFAASPGEEYNFSVWMLTETLLPPVTSGATFGLAKIVFLDATGAALEPASISIGQAGPAANPGVEALPFLNGDSVVNTWIFSEAQGVAPAGTVEVQFLLLNVDFGNGANHPMWFDDAQASLVAPGLALANEGFESGDFSGWTGSGDNMVGAPGVGARSGTSAASLNSMSADGVAEISQIFAASPGEEYNFSVWMLTETLLPPVTSGATFGLAKIVFLDATGAALEPASISIGQAGPAANPGVEALPFLNGDSVVNTWIFSEAQGVAPAGTVEVQFLLLNVDFGNGANHPMWFDDAQASLVDGGSGGPGPMLAQIDLPVTFDDPGTDYDLTDFGDPIPALTMLNADPVEPGNMVAMTTKQMGAPFWAGTTMGDTNGFVTAFPFTASETIMTVRVYSPAAGIIVRLKVEDATDPTKSVETEATTTAADTWETLVFDFANEAPGTAALDLSFTYDKASIFFDFVLDKDGDGSVYYWDDVQFGAPPAPPPATIELANAGFESGDFTDWTVGGNGGVVGAPVAGARTGASAAQLAGGGVAEVRQTFAAAEGDEINLSVWMLTEAALPTGATFGLAKIVFKDAAGNDLDPASASIGTLITGTNPGIESTPTLNDTTPIDTWIFSEAQGVAPAGTAEVVFLLLNIDFAGGTNPMWFDDAQASLVTAELALANAGFESGDFTDWTVGGNGGVVGAPVAGARTGASAAQLAGGGVAEVRQTFAAAEGDEINLSVWMLTEAALPTGATFGLAKIVFKDAAGNDLDPASASIGTLITGTNPGIESTPTLNDTTPIDTWIFSEAQGVAPAGTAEVVFLLLNIDFAGGTNPMWFDDAQAALIGAGP